MVVQVRKERRVELQEQKRKEKAAREENQKEKEARSYSTLMQARRSPPAIGPYIYCSASNGALDSCSLLLHRAWPCETNDC